MLKLELVIFGQLSCTTYIGRLTFFDKLDLFTESVAQPALNEVNREIGNVDADPLPSELLRGMNGRAASAEWIEHNVTWIAGGADDSLKQCDWLLRVVTQPFFVP